MMRDGGAFFVNNQLQLQDYFFTELSWSTNVIQTR